MKRPASILILWVLILYSGFAANNKINLSGFWSVQIDSTRQMISLPGSLSENKAGKIVSDSATNMLSEQYRFIGKAKYEREIDIPDSWSNKPVELFIERTKVSEVFVNGMAVGSQNSVSTPHSYLLKGVLKSGKNKIVITVDNTKSLLPLGGAHAYSEHTQTNWNGILGQFYLRCVNNVDIQNVQVYPQINGSCQLKITTVNVLPGKKNKQQLQIKIFNAAKKQVSGKAVTVDILPGKSEQTIALQIQNPELWDEYHPYLYSLTIEGKDIEKKEISFGFRNFEAQSRQLKNNGRVVFLRGTHEGGVFPLTGYPSMKKEDWLRYYQVMKSYGLNHVRYHSWTPPLAAFEAADESGIFIQPELPLWGSYTAKDTTLFNYMKKEGEKIMQTYGNHPSFVLFALGNELGGDTTLMAQVVDHLKAFDNRHLYAMGSNNFYWDTKTYPSEDFFVSMRNGKEVPDYSTDLRGSFSFADSREGGIINNLKPNAKRNFFQAIQSLHKPVIGHETGQYQVYPNYKEVKKYTGVLQARNFEVFKNRLKKAGMLSQADDFLKASGALAALCYREEIEMTLRTPDFGGFQLLDLKDYPGQGTALVGILDVFLDSKEVISNEKWREFCNDVVPLAGFSKYCWSNNESFESIIEVANYGLKDLNNQTVHCVLKDQRGSVIFEKTMTGQLLKQGKLTTMETLKISLEKINIPQQLTFTINLPNSTYQNSWNIWVYPSKGQEAIREGVIQGVVVTRDKKTFEESQKQGKPVLYIPNHSDTTDQSVGGLFITDFWNYGVFKAVALNMKKVPSPGTMGILTNPNHPLLKGFPTDFHTNWQWWTIVKNSRPIILDSMPDNYLPIVQVIDNVDRNHKLGLIYELPGTKAKTVVCSSDLFKCAEEPEVKALFQSILNYVQKVEN